MLTNFLWYLFKIVIEAIAIIALTLMSHYFIGGELFTSFGFSVIAILIIHYGEELSMKKN